eukprot:1974478-Pyramimonas_sp.AAC.1
MPRAMRSRATVMLEGCRAFAQSTAPQPSPLPSPTGSKTTCSLRKSLANSKFSRRPRCASGARERSN